MTGSSVPHRVQDPPDKPPRPPLLIGLPPLLDRVGGMFHNLTSSETSPDLQAVERKLAPLFAAHDNKLYMHAALFARVVALHARRRELGLSDEQVRVLERYHTDFVRSGAKLSGTAQERYAAVMQRLADLTTRFSQNVLADESGFRLLLESEADLARIQSIWPTSIPLSNTDVVSEELLTATNGVHARPGAIGSENSVRGNSVSRSPTHSTRLNVASLSSTSKSRPSMSRTFAP